MLKERKIAQNVNDSLSPMQVFWGYNSCRPYDKFCK